MRKLILASHGELSKGMLNSVSMIAGSIAESIEVYCLFPGQSPNDYMQEMMHKIQEDQQTEYVFLCDIKGGSVHTSLSRLCAFPNVKVFSGMNVNLVLDLLLSYPEDLKNADEIKLVEHAKEGITIITKDRLIMEEDEDF